MNVVYSSLHALRIFAPEYRWKGIGNVLGDYGECVAIANYSLKKALTESDGYDATTRNDKTVAIKANHVAKMIGFHGDADLLLVVGVEEYGCWHEIYYGSFQAVKAISNFSKRNNKYMISISKLKKLCQQDV